MASQSMEVGHSPSAGMAISAAMTGTSEEACHGLGEASVALLLADRGEELLLQRGVGHLGPQRPAEPSGGKALQCQPDPRRRPAPPAGDPVDCPPARLQ